MDEESLVFVAQDLEYLRDDWGPDTPDPDIRRGSAVLRRLLVEDVYGAAWRGVGFQKQPRLIAVDLMNVFGGVDTSRIICALAWGAHFRGIFMASPCLIKGTEFPPMASSAPVRSDGYPGEREFRISEFLSSPAGIADGEVVTRRDIIKYVANIKGGIHLSQKLKKAERDLVSRLAKFEKKINAHTTDGILVEIVSIAQAVGQSNDAAKLIREIYRRT